MINIFTKSAVACMAMLFCLGGEAGAQNNLCLREINSDIEGDYFYYGYNKDNNLDSIYIYRGFYDSDSYRLYDYDEKGRMISENGYAVLPKAGVQYNTYSKVFEVRYSYDDMNRMATRTNYNIDEFSADLSFVLGGVYVYEYDYRGLLASRKLYWDEAKTDLYEKVEYTYNENNQLAREVYMVYGFNGAASQDMMVEYYYDEQGRNTNITTNTLDANTGGMVESGVCFYEYDEKGNLTSRTSYDNLNPEIPNEKHILIYSDTLSSDVTFPINYEDDMDFFVRSKHVAVQDTIYRRDAEGEVFMLFDIQNWGYEELGASAGIGNVMNNGRDVCFRRDGDGNIIIDGIDGSECVRVYNADGRLVRSELYRGMVSTAGLPKGVYIVMTRNGNMKFSK